MALAIATVGAMLASCSASSPDDVPTSSSDGGQAELAPIFEVETMDGVFSLSDHLARDGRPVFLNLWASWCYPCREEMPAIDAAARRHPEVAFIGVAVQDARDDATSFAEEIGVDYPLGFDDGGEVDGAYAPVGLPASFIISSEGVILERIFGRVSEADLDEKFAEYFG
jgi:cytochrome c biogenesis protein CcmG, thiol:disulfide interchange protein DsbE